MMNDLIRDMGGRDVRPPGAINGILATLCVIIFRAFERLLRWRELAEQRQALLELDGRMLKDIGVSRVDAIREAYRPFWDDPLREERQPTRAPQTKRHGSPIACCE